MTPARSFSSGRWPGVPIERFGRTSLRTRRRGPRPWHHDSGPLLGGKVDRRLERYYDTTVFTQTAAITFGNASQRYNALRADISQNYDLSLFKDFIVKRRGTGNPRAQFRAEALNAFNTPRFGNPATSAIFPPEGPLPSQPTRRAKSKWG